MAIETAKRDPNYVPTLIGVDMSTGLLPTKVYVDETTHRLLVDAAISSGNITLSGADGAITDGVSSSIRATVFDYTNSNPLAVVLRDTNGDYVSVGGGTQYTEDAAAAANPVGNAVNLIRQDTPADEVSTNGDNISQRGTKYGAAFTQIVTSAGAFVDSFGGGTEYTEDAAAAADPVGKANILVRKDTPATITSTDGDNIAQRGTNYGAAYVQIVDSSGNYVNSFGGGTQYTEGDIDASITGTAMLMEVGSNTLQPVQGTVADGLLVNLGANNDVTVTGTVTANLAAGTNNIGDVDVLSVPAPLSTTGGGTEATALRVTVANDSTGVLSVDDNGSSLTVDNGGTFAVQENGAALTSLQLIDDTVYTDGTGTVTKGIAILGQDGTNPQAIKTDANGELQVDVLTMPTVTIQDGGGSITVDGTVTVNATDLDIRNLAPATDTVAIGDGSNTATIRNLASNDALNVAITDGSGNQITSFGGGTQYTEGDTDASITGTAIMYEGDTGTNALSVVSDAAPLPVAQVGATTANVIPDDPADWGVYVEDDLHNSGDKGNFILGVRNDGNSVLTSGNGDYSPIAVGSAGWVKVKIEDVDVDATINVEGPNTIDNATGSAPVQVAGFASTATPSAVSADGDLQNIWLTRNGAVNIADGGGAISVDDNGSSLSVDWAGTAPVTGSGTATGALRVELPTNGTGTVGLNAGTNAIGKLAANSGVDIGDVDVLSIAAGTNNIGQVSVAPQTANGLSVMNASSSDGSTALTNTAQVIKASAGQVYGWFIYNPNSSAQYVQFYNTAAASVTVGTTTPLFMITIPPTAAANVEFTNGITFSNAGFSWAATSTAGGNGAPTTALDAVCFYK